LDWLAVFEASQVNIVETARAQGLFLAVAESLTGGQVTAALIDTAGASEVVLGGLVTYQDALKEQLLGVSPALIASQSSVDPEVAAQMAQGVRAKLALKCGKDPKWVIGLATTGVAGPDPVGPHKSGTVFVAVASENGVKVFAHEFLGERPAVREQATAAALESIAEEIQYLAGY
jgi:nicotinamide-nucleotide amidase